MLSAKCEPFVSATMGPEGNWSEFLSVKLPTSFFRMYFSGSNEIYLYILSFLYIMMEEVIEILPQGHGFEYPTW